MSVVDPRQHGWLEVGLRVGAAAFFLILLLCVLCLVVIAVKVVVAVVHGIVWVAERAAGARGGTDGEWTGDGHREEGERLRASRVPRQGAYARAAGPDHR